jgi:hypothetical protein
MSKTTFITFAGNLEGEAGKYSGIQDAAKRLQKQAEAAGVYCSSMIIGWDEIYKFAEVNHIPISRSPNKYLFKPFLAKMAISGCFGDADIFFYADAGCEISNNRFALSDYRGMIKPSEEAHVLAYISEKFGVKSGNSTTLTEAAKKVADLAVESLKASKGESLVTFAARQTHQSELPFSRKHFKVL